MAEEVKHKDTKAQRRKFFLGPGGFAHIVIRKACEGHRLQTGATQERRLNLS